MVQPTWRRVVANVLCGAMVAGFLVASDLPARYRAPGAQQDWVTPGGKVPVGPDQRPDPIPAYEPAAVQWPAALSVVAAMPRVAGATVAFTGAPVSLRTLATTAGPGALGAARLEVLGRDRSTAAGVRGILLRVGPADADQAPASARVQLRVDYSGFASAFGADWSTRLRVVALPECALTDPGSPTCRGTVLPTSNDVDSKTVAATVDVARPSLLALEGGPSGGAGDFGATTLAPSGTWTAGDSGGGFSWSYPIRVPPGLNGPVPNLRVSYSSQAVDGKMAATQQPAVLARGGVRPGPRGYIERRYKSCADDMGNGANNTTKTGDLCWATNNATLSLAEHAGELLRTRSNPNRWHLRNDDGTYISRRTGSTGNGDNDGEWWVVTTTGRGPVLVRRPQPHPARP